MTSIFSPLVYGQSAKTFRYDPASQVTNILHQLGASGPTINQAAYTYNGVGNRDSLTDRRGVQNFSYDNLDRLTSASHPLLGCPVRADSAGFSGESLPHFLTNAASASHRELISARF